jgi:muramidase (phage lysozyme)
MLSANARALLDTIARAEGTAGSDGYRTMFTGRLFGDLSRHPRQLNSSNGLSSDAAGRYQFLSTTWDGVAKQLGLSDFSPASQDRAALELVRRRGVDPDAPLTKEALNKLAPEWASLPTMAGKSYYGQPVKPHGELFDYYRQRLGAQPGGGGTGPGGQAGTGVPPTPAGGGQPRAAGGYAPAALAAFTPAMDPAVAVLSQAGVQQLTQPATLSPSGNPFAAVAGATLGLSDSALRPAGQRLGLGPGDLGGATLGSIAEGAIASLTGTMPQLEQPALGRASPATRATAGGALPSAQGVGTGAMLLGKVSAPGQDPLPSTGAHLDVRVQRPDGQYINPMSARSLLANLHADGKPLFQQRDSDYVASFPVTSGYGPRNAPTAGASTWHRGIDLGVRAGAPVEWRGTPGSYSHSGGIGILQLPDDPSNPWAGHRVKVLHTMAG